MGEEDISERPLEEEDYDIMRMKLYDIGLIDRDCRTRVGSRCRAAQEGA